MPNDGMIDLGSNPSEYKMAEPTKDSPYYPCLHLNDVEGLDDLPDGEFTFTGKGEVRSRTETIVDGKSKCSYDIEIHGIKPDYTKVKKKKDVGDGLDESLDKIAKHKMDDAEDAADEEDESGY